jgi:hypothetical protein
MGEEMVSHQVCAWAKDAALGKFDCDGRDNE